MVAPFDLLLVEDHTMFREGLVETLKGKPNLRVVGQCGSSSEALELLKQIRAQDDKIAFRLRVGEVQGLPFTNGFQLFGGQIHGCSP